MNYRCVYCQWTLLPGEEQCPSCGRWQPSNRAAYQSFDEPPDDTWEDEDPGWGATSGPAAQRAFRRGEPLEPSYHQRRPSRQSSNLTRPPVRQNSLALKILIVVLAVAVVGLGGGAIAIVLAQGSHPSQGKPGVAAVPTVQTATPASITPTATPTVVTPTPTATPSRAELCAAHSGPALTYQGAPVVPLVFDNLLPDNLPLQPVRLDQVQVGKVVIRGDMIALTIPVNQPPAGQTITVCKATLKLVAFTSIADPSPNVLNSCSGVYLNPGGLQGGGGCGGGYTPAGAASFTITSPQVGTSMISTVNPGLLPAQITATSEDGIEAAIQVSVSGIYTFSVGLWQDNTSGPTFDNQTGSIAVLIGNMYHYWGGSQCETPDMQALLPPPTNPPEKFICPGNPPQA